MPGKVRPNKTEIKKFLDSALIDPNKRDDYISRQLVENGDPSYFEMRVVEYMQEARRLRIRISASRVRPTTLLEEYEFIMRKAMTAIAIAAGKLKVENETKTPKATNRPGSNSSRGLG